MRVFEPKPSGLPELLISEGSNIYFSTNKNGENAVFPFGKNKIGYVIDDEQKFQNAKNIMAILSILCIIIGFTMFYSLYENIRWYLIFTDNVDMAEYNAERINEIIFSSIIDIAIAFLIALWAPKRYVLQRLLEYSEEVTFS